MRRKYLRTLLCCALLCAALLPFAPRAQAAGEKLIAFTFDDGPSTHTPDLLDGLEKRGAVATFFMTGANGAHGVVNHHDLLPRMYALGCQLANHSYSHPNFTKITPDRMVGQLDGVEDYLYAALGDAYLDLVRIPGGSSNATIKATVQHPIIHWSIDPYDWRDRNADTVYQRIMAQAHDGGIVLLHDLYPTSIEGGLRAMDSLKEQGYTFVTVSELFRRRGVYLENGVVYSSSPDNGVYRAAYAAPSVNVSSNGTSVSVSFSSDEAGVSSIHYTTDGSDPLLSSPLYTGPFTVSGEVHLRVAGFDRFATRTPIVDRVIQTATAAPKIGTEQGGTITLTCATEGAKILYTTDGTDPRTNGSAYNGAFTPGAVTRAVAIVTGRARSDVTTITKTKGGALFYDLPADAWYFDAVGDMVKRGLMNGIAPYVFSPDTALTRAALVSVLHRLEGKPEAGQALPFADVKPDEWCAQAVAWAAANGIVTGKEDGLFDPNGVVTRQQAATILYRYAKWSGRQGSAPGDVSGYPDYDKVAPYATEALAWCQGNGMLSAVDGRLAPEDPALRAQCAAMVSELAAMAKK